MRIPDSLVERLLSSSKHASAKQLSALRKHELKDKKTLQDLAISNKLITEKELTRLYAKNIRVPFVELQADEINNEALQRLPERIARKYRSIVFADNDDGSLRLAMDDPKNIEAKRFLQKQLGAKLTIYVATSSALQAALDHYSISTETAALTNPLTLNQKFDEPIKESDLLDSSAAAQTVTALINHALDDDASDIHIEPRENFIVIRFRIDGLLREVVKLPRQSLAAVIGRIKFISNLSTEIHKTPQDGVFSIERKAKSYVLHVSILPILEGEKAVIKIRHESPSATDFTSLGLWGNALNNLHHAIVQPHGLILVTGPVGSGKATTLFSILSTLNSSNVNIATIEDPIKYRIAGANQTQLNASAGIGYTNGLYSLLQQDPNILMIGELREPETARLAIQAAASGHLVFSTLHVSGSANCLAHLRNMGIEPFLVANTTRLVISQRLVRRLCVTCREQFAPSEANLKYIAATFTIKSVGGMERINKLESSMATENLGPIDAIHDELSSTRVTLKRLWKASKDGCDNCNHTGYRGRIGIFEVLNNRDPLQSLLAATRPNSIIEEAAIQQGMIPLNIDGLLKALRGLTTIEEIVRVLTYR